MELPSGVKISHEKPWMYDECRQRWGVDWEHTVFTVGQTIHTKYPLPDDVLVHELVHVRQQTEMGEEEWWYEYFEDDTFRFRQELEAYREQYRWIKKNIKDRNTQARLLLMISKALGGDMYGNIITPDEAMKLIKN